MKDPNEPDSIDGVVLASWRDLIEVSLRHQEQPFFRPAKKPVHVVRRTRFERALMAEKQALS